MAVAAAIAPEALVARSGKGRFYSPLVLNIARTEGVSMQELDAMPGTGSEGRVTKKPTSWPLSRTHELKAAEIPATTPAAKTSSLASRRQNCFCASRRLFGGCQKVILTLRQL
jgi:2-oxoglutarate dehydrogenase E2 component (dihydrolipoamide succinyltransferase)